MDENKRHLLILHALFFFSLLLAGYTNAQNLVKVIAEQALYNNLTPEISQYIADLEADGYSVSLSTGTWTDPAEVRTLLQDEQENGLVGGVLIGEIPMAKFNLQADLSSELHHSFFTPLYYMDIDGSWEGLVDDVFTSHFGNYEADIWIGLIRAENLPTAGNSVDLLQKYFNKIHNYRAGTHPLPPYRSFRFYDVLQPNYQSLGDIYEDIYDPGCSPPSELLSTLLNDPEGFDFAVINASAGHNVFHLHPQPATIDNTYWSTIHTPETLPECLGDCEFSFLDAFSANPKTLFYHLASDETGRFDQEDNLSGHLVFGNDYGLAALASTQRAITGDYMYAHLAAGESFGEAFKKDVNQFLADLIAGKNQSTAYCPEWDDGSGAKKVDQRFYSAVFFGDPTLKINVRTNKDENPPLISNVTVSNITQNSAKVDWETDELGDSQVEYGLTDQYGFITPLNSDISTKHSATLTGLADATTYHFRAVSRDRAGNAGFSVDFTFETAIDLTPPILSNIAAVNITQTSADITWTTDKPADSQVEYGLTAEYGSITDLDNNLVESHSVSIAGLEPNTTYHYRIFSRDDKGNLASSADLIFVTSPDLEAPIVSDVTVVSKGQSTATISWVTNELANSEVEFGETAEYGQTSGVLIDLVIAHTVTLTGLKAGTVYHFRVKSTDIHGNTGVGENQVLETEQDFTGPLISNVTATQVKLDSATISWDTDEPADAQVEYGLTNNYGQLSDFDGTLLTSHSIVLVNLSPGKTYNYRVRSKDASGNFSASGNFVFTTLADITPPAIRNVQVTSITKTSATISWETNEKSNTLVDFGPTTAFGSTAGDVTASVLQHQVVLNDLALNTTYQYQVRSADESGNEAVAGTFAFTTEADFIAPTISNISLGTVTAVTANISWQTDEPANSVVEYGQTEAYGSEMSAAEFITNHNITLDNLTAGTSYHFRVKSSDPSGNETKSLDFGFTTTIDNAAPIISNFVIDEVTKSSARVSWQTNEPAFSEMSYGPSTSLGVTLEEKTTLKTAHSYTITGLQSGRQYFVRGKNFDTVGNTSDSGIQTFTTQKDDVQLPAPTISNIQLKTLSGTSVEISWQTQVSASSAIEYGKTTSYGNLVIDQTLKTLHSLLLSGLDGFSTYHFRVKSANAEGVETVSGDIAFTTGDDGADREPPKITTVFVQSVTGDEATITWRTDEPAKSKLEWGLSTNLGSVTPETDQLSFEHFITLENLLPNTFYYYRPVSRDETGNFAQGSILFFQTDISTGLDENDLKVPAEFALSASYPNPFAEKTRFDITIPESGSLSAVVYNLQGREVARIADNAVSPGVTSLNWNGVNSVLGKTASNGVYIVKFVYAGNFGKRQVLTAKVVLAR